MQAERLPTNQALQEIREHSHLINSLTDEIINQVKSGRIKTVEQLRKAHGQSITNHRDSLYQHWQGVRWNISNNVIPARRQAIVAAFELMTVVFGSLDSEQ